MVYDITNKVFAILDDLRRNTKHKSPYLTTY